jgi:hypothetical protein
LQRCTNHKPDLSNTKVLVLEREEDTIALQSEDDWVSAKELREKDELGKRLLQCEGPERLYTFMRLWEEFTTKHDLVRPALTSRPTRSSSLSFARYASRVMIAHASAVVGSETEATRTEAH